MPDNGQQARSPVAIEVIEERIGAYTPAVDHEAGTSTREAAVAAVLRSRDDITEALFILRATKEGDPWSGHMAFPGGHKDPGDVSLRATAERETLEEVGLDLSADARFIGSVEPVRANPRGRNIDMIVTPFVYALVTDVPGLVPNYEVADILWGSLNDMYDGSCFTHDEFEVDGRTVSFPGYSVGEHVVWGLTLRMLDQFFRTLDPDWRNRYE